MKFSSVLAIISLLLASVNAAPAAVGLEIAPVDFNATASDGLAARGAPKPQAYNLAMSNWAMTTWSGTSCASGDVLTWGVNAAYSCTDMANMKSLTVTNFGGCSTYYYSGTDCQGSPIHVDNKNCLGYANAANVRSFSVQC